MFEKASRLKLRFSFKGQLSVEDLWDLSLNDLDFIYKNLNKVLKDSEFGESLLNTVTIEDEILRIQIDIVKHIFNMKSQEMQEVENKTIKLAEKMKLLRIIASKQDSELQNLSVDELKKRVDNLNV